LMQTYPVALVITLLSEKKEQSMKFAKQYVDAFLKDVGLTKVSDIGKQYTQDKLYEQIKNWPTTAL
jgi:hypothetical protein